MSSGNEDDFMEVEGIPSELLEDAKSAINSLLPVKSRAIYEKTYSVFKDWCSDKKVVKITEDVIFRTKIKSCKAIYALVYFLYVNKNVKENINLGKLSKLVPYLKSKNVDHRKKNSNTFTKEDFEKFLTEADDRDYLLTKTVLILGVSGACRRQELTKITINVEDMGHILVIKVVDTKTHRDRTFTVSRLEYIEIYRKYRTVQPPHTSRWP